MKAAFPQNKIIWDPTWQLKDIVVQPGWRERGQYKTIVTDRLCRRHFVVYIFEHAIEQNASFQLHH